MPVSPGILLHHRWLSFPGTSPTSSAAGGAGEESRIPRGDSHGRRNRMNTNPPQNRGLTAIDGAMVLIIILLIVQIWLLSATLESYLAGHREAAVPGAIISGI